MRDETGNKSRMERWARKTFFILAGVAVLLFAILGISYLLHNKNLPIWTKSENPGQSPGNTSDAALSAFPLSPTHPNVSSVLIHYFLTGTVKEIRRTNGILEVIMDTTGSALLPPIVVTKETRVSKISPPYSSATSEPKTASDLHHGLHIDISTEYDIRSKTWIVRDIFIPTDRNP